ncbi:MAG: hypothetical protein A3J42_01475 [Candidatus Dadabacteria bacterium RIFCSPHIGHO2_12_FULL_53_21]|nr:MAG: hypothetical protein A3J42_01475 [Candidatus Dadabacteria bacterium RIFCSPHIGHO2_12_FULL_53_21]
MNGSTTNFSNRGGEASPSSPIFAGVHVSFLLCLGVLFLGDWYLFPGDLTFFLICYFIDIMLIMCITIFGHEYNGQFCFNKELANNHGC